MVRRHISLRCVCRAQSLFLKRDKNVLYKITNLCVVAVLTAHSK